MAGMKILAIMGSRRKNGTGTKVAREIEEGMRQKGEVSFEYLYLRDMHLLPCRGCFQCISRGVQHCPLNDDRAAMKERIEGPTGSVSSRRAMFRTSAG
jgi:multimeric flavodoxin WrbA